MAKYMGRGLEIFENLEIRCFEFITSEVISAQFRSRSEISFLTFFGKYFFAVTMEEKYSCEISEILKQLKSNMERLY